MNYGNKILVLHQFNAITRHRHVCPRHDLPTPKQTKPNPVGHPFRLHFKRSRVVDFYAKEHQQWLVDIGKHDTAQWALAVAIEYPFRQ